LEERPLLRPGGGGVEDDIKMDLTGTGGEVVEWIHVAQDRD